MQIGPETIEIEELPRLRIGGLRPDVVENLFRRVQWNYAQLESDYRKLNEALEQLRDPQLELPLEPPSEVPPSEGPSSERPSSAFPSSELPSSVEPQERRPGGQRPSLEHDELARRFLAAAQQAAHELRESARRDCELMLKKARARAIELNSEFEHSKALREAKLVEVEREFEHSKAMREAELAALDSAVCEIRDEMMAALRSIVSVELVAEPGNGTEAGGSPAPELGLPSRALHAVNGGSETARDEEPAAFARTER